MTNLPSPHARDKFASRIRIFPENGLDPPHPPLLGEARAPAASWLGLCVLQRLVLMSSTSFPAGPVPPGLQPVESSSESRSRTRIGTAPRGRQRGRVKA